MLTERSIINFLIWVGGLILGPYLVSSMLWGNFAPLGVVAAAAGLFLIFRFGRDRLCILPMVGYSMSGRISFLPGRMSFNDFGVIALIVYYLFTYTALRRKKMMTGPLYFFIPIMIVAAIVLYHDHSFSLRMEGGGREGGRGAIFVIMGAIAYLCGVSVNTPSPRFFFFAPLICGLAGIASSLPYVITTYVPSAAPFLYMFSDNVNVSAYTASVLDDEGIVRSSGQAGIASAAIMMILCYFPAYSLWRPNRWWLAIALLVCLPLVITSGFRSAFFTFSMMLIAAVAAYSTWRVVLLVPALAAGVFLALFLQNSHLVKLPESTQRTLSFLPGDWDPEVAASSSSSNDFRDQIKTVYLREEFSKNPFFGNGLTYDSAEFAEYTNLAKYHETTDGYYNIKEFLTGKLFHIGWISLYDAVGLVGGAAFVFFGLGLIWVTSRMIFKRNVDRSSPLFPLRVWVFCNVLPSFIGFFTVFGDFKTAFPTYCCYAIVWTHLNRLDKFGFSPDAGPQPVPFDPERAQVPVPA